VAVPPPHPVEFRQRAVDLARKGDKPVAQLAKDLGISESCLRNWMSQAGTDDNGGAKLTSAEKKGRSQSVEANQAGGLTDS
jgi:transposase-like protein